MIRSALLVVVLCLAAWPVIAQETPPAEPASPPADQAEGEEGRTRWGWGLLVGQLPGGRVLENTLDVDMNDTVRHFEPELDDAPVVGAVYYNDLAKHLRFEGRLNFASTDMLDTPNGDVSTTLFYGDLAVMPRWEWSRFSVGFPIGVGWASASADGKYSDRGTLAREGKNADVSLKAGSGMTYFLGAQGGWKLAEHWAIALDVRARRFHRLTNVLERTLKTEEITLAVMRTY
ncbi:MAG: hypothetical protein KBD01_16780 [Acidobacteria bacterium]|nr:hypothetical protein [Acidobacteriota bacterium]